MKKIILFLVIGCMLLCLSSCGVNTDSNETIKFDLSNYNAHGELSCGLIWVEKTVSDWNKESERQFAYFDANGNQRSKWFSFNDYLDPQDFSNGYVIVSERAYEHSDCIVYDTNFQEIASFTCNVDDFIGINPYVTSFDEQGYAYALGYTLTYGNVLYFIDSNGLHMFENPERESYTMIDIDDLYRIKKTNNHFVFVSGSSDTSYLYTIIAHIYDINGELVLDIEEAMETHIEDFSITSAEVLENNTVKFYFYGVNKKRYVATMDFNGNFVKYPQEV